MRVYIVYLAILSFSLFFALGCVVQNPVVGVGEACDTTTSCAESLKCLDGHCLGPTDCGDFTRDGESVCYTCVDLGGHCKATLQKCQDTDICD